MHNLRLIAGFVLHIVAALGLFALIGGAAALLNLYTRFLEHAGMAPFIIQVIHWMEYVLFGADLLCFLVYLGREVWRLLYEILSPSPALPDH